MAITYTTLEKVKDRILIARDDTTFDVEIPVAIVEAERIIDEKIRPYKSVAGTTESKEPFVFATLPLTAAIIPNIISEICADLAAGLFKRRMKPEQFDQGWLNQGLTKLDAFVKANWFKGAFAFSTTEAEEEVEEGWLEKLFNLIAAIKGAGWTVETLKAIKDAIDEISVSGASAAEVWAYATRTLTDPASYKADVSALALEATLTAIKGAGWTDENIKEIVDYLENATYGLSALKTLIDTVDTVVDAIKVNSDKLPRLVSFMDFWSDNDDEIVLTTTATDDHALPTLVVAGIPANATLVRVVAMLKIALIKDTSTADNAVNGATTLKGDADGGYGSLVTAIDIPDNSWAVDVSEATERGGDVMIGDNDVKTEIAGNGTFYARLEDIACDGNNLKLKDVCWGVRVYFTV